MTPSLQPLNGMLDQMKIKALLSSFEVLPMGQRGLLP